MSLKIKNKKSIFTPDTLLSCIYNYYVYESFNTMNEKSKSVKKLGKISEIILLNELVVLKT